MKNTKRLHFGGCLLPGLALGLAALAQAGPNSLNQLESLGVLSGDRYGRIFDGNIQPAADFSVAGPDETPVSPDNQALRRAMLENLDFIKNIIQVQYAPAEWKKQQYNWDLDAQMQKARNEVMGGNVTVGDYHKIVKGFLASMRDYHVGVQFTQTEAAGLPFSVMEAKGRYFITWVDRGKLPETSFPFKAGDELVGMDGKPVAVAIQKIKQEMGESSPLTDKAIAALVLTGRSAANAMNVPQGPVLLTLKPSGSATTVTHQVIWDYTPEQIRYKNRAIPGLEAFGGSAPIPLAWLDDVSWDGAAGLNAAGNRPFGIGARESFVPSLGPILWESGADSPFRAYIYSSTATGKNIGYIRIPSYMPKDADASVAAFAAIIAKFNTETDGLVIDQVNNPGGSVFYLYALVSMLTNQAMATPRHQIALTQSDLEGAVDFLKKEPLVKTDDDAKKVLGPSLGGYPVSYEVFRHIIGFSRFVIDQWNSGKRLTDPTYIFGVDYINPSPVVRYEKPIMVLVNELDFSGGDFFPAIMQDNRRAVIFGARTAGAGGAVKPVSYPNQLGISRFSLTGTIARRINGKPIENLGVTPDVKYARTAADLRNGFQDYASAVNRTMSDLLK